MYKVKEFRFYENKNNTLEREVNNWLEENPNVSIKDIKYSLAGGDLSAVSGALIVYEVKNITGKPKRD